MMNIFALSLVLSSLAAAGIWSPTPQREHVRVKDEGHRVSVAEYDEGKPNTQVSISSPPQQQPKFKEAAAVLPNLGQGISPGGEAGTGSHFPGEHISDAFGKCTQTISNVLSKAKDKVSEAAEEAEETAQQTNEAVGDALGEAKEAVAQKAEDTVEMAKDTAKTIQSHLVNNGTEVERLEKARKNAMEEAKEARDKTGSEAKNRANKLFNGVKKYMSTMESLNPVMGIVNLVGSASAYGMCVWVTFISSSVLAEMLPRQQFGVVQSKIYPVYFKAMGFSIGLALLGHLLGQRKTLFSSKSEMFQAFNLLTTFLLVLVNALYLEPKATEVLLERMKIEKEEERGRDRFVVEESRGREVATKSRESEIQPSAVTIARLNERLKKLNSKSSFINVVTLTALTWHLLYLAQRLSFNERLLNVDDNI